MGIFNNVSVMHLQIAETSCHQYLLLYMIFNTLIS